MGGKMMKTKAAKGHGTGSKQSASLKASTAKEERGEKIPDSSKEKGEKLFDGAGKPMSAAKHKAMYSFSMQKR